MKQKNVKRVGAIFESAFTVLPILSIINYLSISTVLYASIREYLLVWVPWMQLWVFILMLMALGLVLMVVTYKWVLPSIWTFRGKQMFSHDSEVIDKLDGIEQRLGRMEAAARRDGQEEDDTVQVTETEG